MNIGGAGIPACLDQTGGAGILACHGETYSSSRSWRDSSSDVGVPTPEADKNVCPTDEADRNVRPTENHQGVNVMNAWRRTLAVAAISGGSIFAFSVGGTFLRTAQYAQAAQ